MITPQVVDWLLYNRFDLRAEIEVLEPKTSASVITLPVRRRPELSPIEHVAISRAAISTVLDVVDDAVSRMPRALRRIIKLKYEENLTVEMIARRVHWSERTCYRRIDAARARVARALELLKDERLAEFWQTVGRFVAA